MTSIAILLVAAQDSFHLKRAVQDLERARTIAVAEGHSVVISVLPFSASDGTRAWLAERAPPPWQILPGEEGDLSSAISAWVSGNTSERLGVMGPHESISARWLAECAARPAAGRVAWHPEAIVTYGPNFFDRGEMSLVTLPPRVDRLGASSLSNLLPASFVAPRELLAANPYPRVDAVRGWGQVGWTPLMQWWWVNRLLVAGVEFEAVPGCLHFRAMPDGEGPESLLTPQDAHLMGPYHHDAPEPAAAPRFYGWQTPMHAGPAQMIPRNRHQREMEGVKGYLKLVEEARDFWHGQSNAWEQAAQGFPRRNEEAPTHMQVPLGSESGVEGDRIARLKAELAHIRAERQAYLEDRDRWQVRGEACEAAYRAGLPHRIMGSIKARLAGPLSALRRGR